MARQQPMESIDLGGDRKGLIDLVYGPPKETKEPNEATNSMSSASATHSISTLAPLTENEKNEKREKKKKNKEKKPRRGIGFPCAVCLFFLVAIAIFLSAYAAYFVTKEDYEMKMRQIQYAAAQPRRNSSLYAEEPIFYEEEEPTDGPTAAELRLPTSFTPIWYNLTLKAYLPGYVPIPKEKNLTTEGHILIKMKANEDTDMIVLNSRDFTFPSDVTKAKILSDGAPMKMRFSRSEPMSSDPNKTNRVEDIEASGVEPEPLASSPAEKDSGIKVTSIKYNKTVEMVKFQLDKKISKGQEIILKFPFGGVISDSLNGIYFSTYNTAKGDVKTLVLTQFEPSKARNLVPCFDEPLLKAVWRISIIHPKDTTARSNANDINTVEVEPDWLMTTFEETDKQSSYLTAITISDFQKRSLHTGGGLEVNVWSRPEALNFTEAALDYAVKSVEILEQHYKMPLNAKKMDLFAAPDFDAGAMENTGLILFREKVLLFDAKNDLIKDKVRIAQVVAHEISHQWFGNLVTLFWWDSLWLNEAFATYMEYFVMQKIFQSELNIDHLQLADSTEYAMVDDSLSTSHPLTMNVETPIEAYEIFDSITYDKGAAVIRMLKEVIGEKAFHGGVQKYLHQHAYGNANYTDLWEAFQSEVPKELKSWNGENFDVADFANKWVLQMGYPVVDVYRLDAHTVELSQRRFKIDNLTPERAKFRNALYWYKWEVPLFIEVNGEKKEMQWLHEAYRQPLNLTETLMVNTDSLGFYRVNYEEAEWRKIGDILFNDRKRFSTTTRARLLSDIFALAEAGQQTYETALNVSSYLSTESEFLPWFVSLDAFKRIIENLGDSEEGIKFKEHVSELLRSTYATIDLSSLQASEVSEFFDSRMKTQILDSYCALNRKDCGKNFKSLFEENLIQKCDGSAESSVCSTVPLDIRDTVYCNGVARGEEEEFEKVQKLFEKETQSGERLRLIEALACSYDPDLLRKLLHESLKGGVKKQDIHYLIRKMSKQPVGKEIVTNYIIDNWKDIEKYLSDDHRVISSFVKSMKVDNEREKSQMERFLVEHPSAVKKFPAFKKKLEHARSSVKWLQKSKKQFKNYFNPEKSEKAEEEL